MTRNQPKPLEKDVQRSIIDALTLAGFTVQETTAYRQKGTSGVDKGIPDLLVYTPGLPIIIGMEVKRSATAKRRPEQVAMNDQGYYAFVCSVEEAFDWVQHILSHQNKSNIFVIRALARLARVRDGLK